MRSLATHIVLGLLVLSPAATAQSDNPFDAPAQRSEILPTDPFAAEVESEPKEERPSRVEPFVKQQAEFGRRAEKLYREFMEHLERREFDQLEKSYAMLISEHRDALQLVVHLADELDKLDLHRQEQTAALEHHITMLRDEQETRYVELNRLARREEELRKEVWQYETSHATSVAVVDSLWTLLIRSNDDDAISFAPYGSVRLRYLTNLLQHQQQTIRKLAAQLLLVANPPAAAAQDFQVPRTYWLPVETLNQDAFGASDHRARLLDVIWIDAGQELSSSLPDIVSELQFSFHCHQSDQLDGVMTTEIREAPFAMAMHLLLSQAKLDFVLRESVIEAHPIGSEKLLVSLNYQVRGLISERQSIESIAKLISDIGRHPAAIHVTIVGDYQVLVEATEMQHLEIAKRLAHLPRSYTDSYSGYSG